jgi:hypothetical protein
MARISADIYSSVSIYICNSVIVVKPSHDFIVYAVVCKSKAIVTGIWVTLSKMYMWWNTNTVF